MVQAIAPDGRFAWVEDKEQSGGVYEVEGGARVLLPRVGAKGRPPLLERDGTLDEDADRPDYPSGTSHHAVVLTEYVRFRLAGDGAVTEDAEILLLLAEPPPVVRSRGVVGSYSWCGGTWRRSSTSRGGS